jgi:hypothetical protein
MSDTLAPGGGPHLLRFMHTYILVGRGDDWYVIIAQVHTTHIWDPY